MPYLFGRVGALQNKLVSECHTLAKDYDAYDSIFSYVRQEITRNSPREDCYNIRGIIAEIYCNDYSTKFTGE